MKNIWSEEAKSHILDLLKTEVLVITFTKKDGLERVMKCTLLPEVLITLFFQGDDTRNDFSGGINVVDTDINQWRRIRWDSIVDIKGDLDEKTTQAR